MGFRSRGKKYTAARNAYLVTECAAARICLGPGVSANRQERRAKFIGAKSETGGGAWAYPWPDNGCGGERSNDRP